MVIDGHAHACGEYLTVESTTDYLSRNNVDKVVLVPGELNINPQLISEYRLKRAINHLGSERFILGSDTPYGKDNLSLNIRRINELPVPQNDKDLIMGKTMKYLLKI